VSCTELLEPTCPEPATAPPPDEVNASILVVEDDPRSARMLAAALTSAGHRVAIATSGEEAAKHVAEATVDLVLCDVCLPGMDGIELTRGLRANPETRTLPMLLVTSVDDRKILTRALEAGADDFLTKPVNSVELRTRVRTLLRNKSLAEELQAREAAAASFNTVEIAATPLASSSIRAASILLIEDNPQEARLIEAYLGSLAEEVHLAGSAEAATRKLEERAWDVVVLDLVLPDSSGYSIIELIKSNPRHAQTLILVVSGITDVQDRVRALELGADDFIVKGFDRMEFEARVRRLVRLKQSLDQLNERCDAALRQAVTDSLTGLYTHGFLQDTLQRQTVCARRYGWPLSLLFLDLDHFKRINDHYGHAVGDEVLRTVADCLKMSIRPSDIAVRYGGEEFVVLLPHTSRGEAEQVAERLRADVEKLTISCPSVDNGVHVTVSVGVACFPDDAADAPVLLQRADEAMYLAKQAGRNRVVVIGAQDRRLHAQPVVLLVDDDDRNLRLLEAYLRPENYALIKACDGLEAIEVARRQHPDLIVMDGMMPRLSGFDACRRLKQENSTSLIPVIIVTALNGRDDKLRGIEAGADDFLTKPLDKVQLIMRSRALLRSKRRTDTLEDAETVIFALARAVENRDPSTGGHTERVSQYAMMLGKALGLSGPQLDGLRKAGVVHDIGKIAIPDSILLKPGKLSAEERKVMETHTEVGYELLQPMRTFGDSLSAVRFHHERLNGSGYPLGLKGEQVPITAQILAVVDVFDALTNDRVYRKAMTRAEAFTILRDEASRGLHNADVVEAFAAALESINKAKPIVA